MRRSLQFGLPASTAIVLSVALVLTAVVASASVSAAGRAAASRAAKTKGWQALPGLELGHGQALARTAWASGRAWFLVASEAKLTFASARVRGTSLTSFETTRVTAPVGWNPIVLGSDVLYQTTRTTSGVSRLLSDGRVGPAEAPSPDPLTAKVGAPVAATRVGGRVVWALAGSSAGGQSGNYKPTLWACCDEAGVARDLTSLITPIVSSPPRGHALDVDARGRLWLAWFDGRITHGEVRAVQLDPSTLAPQARKALVAPMAQPPMPPPLSTSQLALACSTTCRLVLGSYYRLPSGGGGTRIVTWAPGERSVTPVGLPRGRADASPHPVLLAAAFRGSKLAIAYTQDSTEGRVLRVGVGDARGRHLRTVGSAILPELSRGVQMYSFYAGAFTPTGFVFAQMYSNYGLKGRVLATVIPLR